jgi:integrase
LNNFNAVFGNRIAGTIKPTEIEDYQEDSLESRLSANTLDVELTIVKGMINKAFDNDMIGANVLRAFRKIKKRSKKGDNARRRTITIQEYLKLKSHAQPHLRNIIIVAMNTGLRPGELKKLKWNYIDRKAGIITFPAEETKERKEKKVPINHHVEAVLNALPRHIDHDYVFTYRGKPIFSNGGVKGALMITCRNAKIPYGRNTPNGIIMHDFRRTVKTNMVKAGVDRIFRDLILGHSLQGMDIHYISPEDDDLRNAIVKYTEWLDEQVLNVDQNVDQVAN